MLGEGLAALPGERAAHRLRCAALVAAVVALFAAAVSAHLTKGGAALIATHIDLGLTAQVLALCDRTVRIPMEAHCESLNAAMAAAVLLWESWR